jgi:hypothetical protein
VKQKSVTSEHETDHHRPGGGFHLSADRLGTAVNGQPKDDLAKRKLIHRVDIPSGLITAKKVGTIKVGARPSSINKWSKATLKITDSLMPTASKLKCHPVAGHRLHLQLIATALPSPPRRPSGGGATARRWPRSPPRRL